MTCEYCKTDFTPKNARSKFCTVKCKQSAYRARINELVKSARATDAFITNEDKHNAIMVEFEDGVPIIKDMDDSLFDLLPD